MKDGIYNAVIISATLSNAEHNALLSSIELDYGGSKQSFGGYLLYTPKEGMEDSAGYFIWRVLAIANVNDWARLPGRPIRVQIENGLIFSIGHFLNEEWFCLRKELR